jgi:hypothetical protein
MAQRYTTRIRDLFPEVVKAAAEVGVKDTEDWYLYGGGGAYSWYIVRPDRRGMVHLGRTDRDAYYALRGVLAGLEVASKRVPL